MSDWHGSGDDLILPFLFVPHGAPESPEVAAFKSRYPDWFSIPADFVAHDDPDGAFASLDASADGAPGEQVADHPVKATGTMVSTGENDVAVVVITATDANSANS